MRLLILAFLWGLILSVACCPPDDDEMAKVSKPLNEKFQKDICGQGIKPGGKADLEFMNKVILPHYMTKKWLTKAPPSGWEKEKDKIVKKCYKDKYNFCSESDQKSFGDCVKSMAGSLMLKYGATAMSYCPIMDKKIANWDTDDKPQALKFFTQYCKTKGKKC